MTACISRRSLGLAIGGALSLCAAAVTAHQAATLPAPQIAIENFAFLPPTVTIPAGTQVVWINRDEEPHTVNSIDKTASFKSAALDTGDKFAFLFDRPGRYRYFCSIHHHMIGTIVVK
jgi:plastocyanin